MSFWSSTGDRNSTAPLSSKKSGPLVTKLYVIPLDASATGIRAPSRQVDAIRSYLLGSIIMQGAVAEFTCSSLVNAKRSAITSTTA
eukprot:scaffold2175_cov381-Prasinococcus_capsulatus_cf.AAC.3